jgi:hypothetical protein
MGPKFFETKMGHQFYDGTMPRIAKALERIATAMEKQQQKAHEADDPHCTCNDCIASHAAREGK